MGFNGIGFYTSIPGEIPVPIVVAYFVIAFLVAIILGKRNGGLKAFSTIDWVYIGIGAAAAYVWEFIIGAIIGRIIPSGISTFVDPSFWGRMFIVFIVAALVRKVGVGMISLFLFDILGDLFHYGFSGEPMFFIYESLTYGLFVDLAIAATGGKLFGIGISKGLGYVAALAAIEGGIIGLLWAIPDPIFYRAFFDPLIYGATVNYARVVYDLIAFIPGDVAIGILAGLSANRVEKAVQV
ncbi:hypothetical protein [Acidianus brierleyi]|uniref:Uncharacterized protein n=1 Tax=Acidianus brierleyi TaxID=41673 RepID=A0A2U9IDR9_9CREN|nr:hypothetical protein [Acidianus brierleyi]AWR94140.1 hypothetical protein DFR85_05570 [Acidianus brierleyi]